MSPEMPPWERRRVNYENVAMEFDGQSHDLVERVDDEYEPVDE